MSALPPPLAPWAPVLQAFLPEVALAIGAQVVRLAAALGPVRDSGAELGGEHTGYAGLSRRGPPERLLLTEWAMALEYPEEFLRRAAMNEQSYLEREHQRPRQTKRCMALFDAGPTQLGSPRIAQIAVLVVLARRAEAAGVELDWAVLQDRRDGAFRGFHQDDVQQLLRARSTQEVSTEDVEHWSRRLDFDSGEVWLIGSAELRALVPQVRAHHVSLEDPWTPTSETVEVTIQRPGTTVKKVVLPLPDAKVRGRLIRDPFYSARAPALESESGVEHSLPQLSGDAFTLVEANRLIYRSYADQILSVAIPNGSSRKLKRPKWLALPGGYAFKELQLFSVGSRKNHGLFVVCRIKDSFLVSGKDFGRGYAPLRIPIQNQPAIESAQAPAELREALVVQHRGAQDLITLDASGLAIRLHPHAPYNKEDAGAAVEAWGVTAMADLGSHVVFAQRSPAPGASTYQLVTDRSGPLKIIEPFGDEDSSGACFFGYPEGRGHFTWGVCAVHLGGVRWRIYHSLAAMELSVDATAQVVGVVVDLVGLAPGLLTVDESRCRLSIVSASRERLLWQSRTPIRRVVASRGGPMVALTTEEGLVVFHSSTAEVYLNIAPGAPA